MTNAELLQQLLVTYQGLPAEEQAQFAADMQEQIKALTEDPYGLVEETYTEGPDGMVAQGGAQMSNEPAPIGVGDRALVKNLGNSTYDAIKFLAGKYPNLDFAHDGKGNVLAKTKGTEAWQPLDPETDPTNPETWATSGGRREMLQDVLDIPADVGAGLATGTGATLGALGGAAAGGGIGALPGSMAGSATAAGVYDTARQAAGKATGVNQAVDPSQVAEQALWAGATAPIAGTGVGQNLLSRSAAKGMPGLMPALRSSIAAAKSAPLKDVAALSEKEVLDQAGKMFRYGGLLPKMTDTIGSTVKGGTALMSGTRPETIGYMAEGGRIVPNELATRPLAEAVQSGVRGASDRARRDAGQAMDEALTGQTVNIKAMTDRLAESIRDARKDVARHAKGSADRKQANRVLEGLKSLAKDVRKTRTGQTVDTEGYQFLNQKLSEKVNWTDVRNVQPTPKSTARAKIGFYAQDLKEILNNEAEKQVQGLSSARSAYETAKQKGGLATSLVDNTKWRGDMRKVERVVGEQGPDMKAVKDAAGEIMTPEEYKKLLADTEALGANLDYLYAKNTFTPTGTMTVVGAPGSMLLKSAPAKVVAKTGATALRASAPVNTALKTSMAYGRGAVDPFEAENKTLSPQTRADQTRLIEYLKTLGGN